MTRFELLALGAAGLAILAAGAARAAEADAEASAQIIVPGERPGYRADIVTSATKTPTPLRDVPQSVTVVTQELIEDANLRSIADIIRLTPGATIGQGEGHRDQITIRGVNSTADFYLDGLRDDVQYYRPLYNLARVEVLKGANALAFGRGGGGGVVNRVTKVPGQDAFATFEAGVDTFGAYALQGDGNIELSETLSARLNGLYEDGRNHRDVFEFERYAANPSIAWRPDADTILVASYEYLKDFRVVDRGVPSLDGRPIRGLRDTFFGVEGLNEANLDAHVARLRGEHEVSEALSVSGQFFYGDYDKSYRNAFPAGPLSADPDEAAAALPVEAYFDPTERRNLFGQVNATWKTATGPVRHLFLGGLEAGDQRTRNQRINGFFDSGVPTTSSGRRTVIPFVDPIAFPEISFRAGEGNRSVETDAQLFSVYVQDQAELGPVQLTVGVRYDRFDLEVEDRLASAVFTRIDDLVSPRAGLVVKPIEPLSFYASFSRSFLPQSGEQFLSLDLTSEALRPERFDNYEIGAKWDVLPRLAFTAALFQLERTNTRAPSGEAGVVVLTGEQRSRGLELGLSGEVSDRWSVFAGYTLQDAEITSDTAAAPAGRDVAQVPRHIVSLWSRYDFTKRFGAAFGLQHQGDSFAAISNATVLPSFTRLDAALFFALTERLEAQVNLENLTNGEYFPTAHTDNNITTGAPINARFTIRAKF